MKTTIFHLGISTPPSFINHDIKVVHTPVIEVKYNFKNNPREISDFLQINPIVLILSQNGVRGLKKWLNHFNLESDYFNKVEFWTVGERTHECLHNELNIISSYPDDMTGLGAIKAFYVEEKTRVLLISGQALRSEFISGLIEADINYFQFQVYKTQIIENEILQSCFEDDLNNYLVFTSPSTVLGLLQNKNWNDLGNISSHCISIGPTTSNSISQKGGNIFIESESQNINNLYSQLSELIINPV